VTILPVYPLCNKPGILQCTGTYCYLLLHIHLTLQSLVVILCTTGFNIQKFYYCSRSISVFCVDLKKKEDYIPTQNKVTGPITDKENVYCAVRTVL